MLPHRARSVLVARAVAFTLTSIASIVATCAVALAGFSEDFEQPLFDEGIEHYVKDHSLVRGIDGLFHLYYIVGQSGEDWREPGNEVDFGHASSPDLRHWTVHPRVLGIDPANEWKSRNVWSPSVLAPDYRGEGLAASGSSEYLMAYTGIDSAMNQAVGFARAENPFPWTDVSVTAPGCIPDASWARWNAGGAWSNFRDPYLRREGGEILFLATAQTRNGYLGLPSRGAIALARSLDGLNFTDAGAPLVINNSSALMESPHLAYNRASGIWHLFYTRTVEPAGVYYLTSVSPTSDWDISSNVRIDPDGFASEISGDDETIYSSVISMALPDDRVTRAIRFDSLSWAGGMPQLVRLNPFRSRWLDVHGSFPGMPTYHDRPAARGGAPSNIEGRFWINTAEGYAGPYGGESAAGANEAQTGVLRSEAFTIAGAAIELWVGGSQSPRAYVALVDSASGEALRSETGSGSDVMSRRTWDVSPLNGQRVVIEIVDQDPAGHVSVDAIREVGGALAVRDGGGSSAAPWFTAAPNPAPGWTQFFIKEDGARAAARLSIYDLRGRLIRRLEPRSKTSGDLHLTWDGRGSDGRPAGAGVYVARIEAKGTGAASSIRIVLLR